MSRECLSANTSPTNLRGYGFPWGSRTSSGAMVTVAPFTVTVLVMVLLTLPEPTHIQPIYSMDVGILCQWQEYHLEVRHCNSAKKKNFEGSGNLKDGALQLKVCCCMKTMCGFHLEMR
jgi:hypothetical protein